MISPVSVCSFDSSPQHLYENKACYQHPGLERNPILCSCKVPRRLSQVRPYALKVCMFCLNFCVHPQARSSNPDAVYSCNSRAWQNADVIGTVLWVKRQEPRISQLITAVAGSRPHC